MSQTFLHYTAVGRVIQFLGALGIITIIGVALFTWFHVRFNLNAPTPFVQFLPLLLLILVPMLLISLGTAVREHKNWARPVAMVIGVLLLLAFPLGTLVGAYILWGLAKHWRSSTYAGTASV